MAHSPKAIYKAVVDKWEAATSLVDEIPTVYLGGPPRRVAYPFAWFLLFMGQSDTFHESGNEPLEIGILRFSIFDSSTSQESLLDIVGLLHAAFDDQDLVFDGGEYSPVALVQTRFDFKKDAGVWRADTDYDLMAQGT